MRRQGRRLDRRPKRRAGRFGVSAGSELSPDIVAGLVAWWDADDEGTITDTAGEVDQWDDKTASGFDLTATLTTRPLTGTRTINGRNVLDFDGVNDSIGRAALTETPPVSIYVVVEPDALGDNTFVMNTGAPGSLGIQGRVSTAMRMNGPSANTGITQTGLTGEAHIIRAIANGASSSIRADLGTPGTGNIGATGFEGTFRLGSSSSGATSWMNCAIAEFLIYNSVLSAEDDNTVMTYLANKWGVTL